MTVAHLLATCCWPWEVGSPGIGKCLLLWKREVLVRNESSDPVMGEGTRQMRDSDVDRIEFSFL